MNLRQAAQQALEALVTCCAEEWRTLNNFGMKQVYDEKKVNAAIAALRAAIAEPDQKPVASLMTNIQSGDQKVVWNDDGFDRALWHETPLYTAPISRKPWVGLTVEEIFDCTHHITRIQQDEWVATDADLCEFAHIVEKQLQKKNGYGTWNKPLTKEQIDNICKSFRLGYTDEELVRAIERAHGIGESNG